MFFNTTKFYTISFFCKHNFFIDEIETYAMNVQKQPPEVFCKKMCSWKFRRIHRQTPVPEVFLNKVAGLRPATLLKKRLLPQACNFIKKEALVQVFSYEFC